MKYPFPHDWRLMPLEEAMSAIIDYRGKSPVKTSYGVPLVTARIVKGGRILEPDEYISEDDYESWMRRGLPEPGDVLITTEAPLGEVAQLGTEKVALAQRLIGLRGKPGVVDNTFLKFALQSGSVREQILSRATGTTVTGIRQSELRKVLLPLPPFAEQQSLAMILGAMDDKIELNHRMNETLEAIARTLFKSWFVDFDPVREGHSLFPSSFQESSVGSIPEGWKLGNLEDLLILQRGFDLPVGERRPGTVPVIAASGPVGFHDEARVKGLGVVTGRSGVLGKVFLLLEDFWPLNTSLWVKEFRGSRPIHAYHLLQTLDFSAFNAGSAVPTLNRNHVHTLRVFVPPLPVVESFEREVSPLFELRAKNDQQSETFAALRDTLLPKLLSGEIRVKQAEKIVSDAV